MRAALIHPRLLHATCLLLLVAAALAGAAEADVVRTDEGLVLEGSVKTLADGALEVTTATGTVVLQKAQVASHEVGPGPRTRLATRAKALGEKDVRGHYALALEANAAGLPDVAEKALRRVIALEPGHRAARRELGYELLQGRTGESDAWVSVAEARRQQGLVRFAGRWVLPAEVERISAAKQPVVTAKAEDVKRALGLVRRIAGADVVLRDAARLAWVRTDETLRIAAAKQALLDGKPAVRRTACALLAELSDESTLKALIFSGARDQDESVRRRAVEAALSYGHDDLAIPFVRALGSSNQRLAANAAEALAQIGDARAAGYIVKRLTSHGHSTRNFVAFVNQISYVRDYDVEIAQASNIANPDIGTIMEGVILDARVLDAAITKTWIEPILVDSLSQLAGRPLRSKAEAIEWYAANKDRLPGFPEKPGRRAPRRSKGRMVGAPQGS